MTETKEVKEPSGIAVLPNNDKRPIAIVGVGSTDAVITSITQLSEQFTELGMVNVILSLDEAKEEGITEEELIQGQLEQSHLDELLEPNPIFDTLKRTGGTNTQQKFKRKKKGTKTHRKK